MTQVATIDPETVMPEDYVADGTDETHVAVCADLESDHDERQLRYTERPMIPVELLTAHPGNVRENAKAGKDLCASVAAVGVIDPLEITPVPGSELYRVVDGHLRLDAALKVGLTQVPYVFNADTVDDEARQFLHMLITSRFRTDLTPREEAAALFQASQSMTRTEIRKATGLRAAEVKAGIRVGKLKAETFEFSEHVDYEWTLEDLALLAPFEDDAEAMDRIARECSWGRPLKYTVQKLLDERAAQARKRKLIAELEAAGTAISDNRPDGAVPLRDLRSGEEEMNEQAHAGCPGRGAYFPYWSEEPSYYCSDPVRYGHVFTATGTTEPPVPPEAVSRPVTRESEKPSIQRRIVIEGNKAWSAAATVRQQWLAEFLTRKSPPKDVAAAVSRFVATQLLTMPEPLCRALGGAKHSRQFETFGKPDSQAAAKSSLAGLWLLALVPIATAYEREITGDGERRNTWRKDKFSPCSYEDAGDWLRFVIEIGAAHGFEPSPIEQAVADGTDYQGDTPTGVPLDAGEGDTNDNLHGPQGDDACRDNESPQDPDGTDAVTETDPTQAVVSHDPEPALATASHDLPGEVTDGDLPDDAIADAA